MKNKSKLLWIPRALVILVSAFYLYLVIACLIYSHSDLLLFTLSLIILLVILVVSAYHSLVSGGFLVLSTIDQIFSAKSFNSFIYYPLAILLIAGILLIVFSFFPKKCSTIIEGGITKSKNVKPIKVLGFIFLVIFTIIPTFIVLTVLLGTISRPGTTRGDSMLPTIRSNALILINCVPFNHLQPKRGDIIEIYDAAVFKSNFLKRVIGMPGDTVEWKDYNIYINGKKLFEPYEFDSFTKTFRQTDEFDPVKLKDDEYFVMGDNRRISYDSRSFGIIKRDAIIGKVYFFHNPPEE